MDGMGGGEQSFGGQKGMELQNVARVPAGVKDPHSPHSYGRVETSSYGGSKCGLGTSDLNYGQVHIFHLLGAICT